MPDPTTEILEPPTEEMVRWAERLQPLLEGRSWLGTALVTPIAHFANGSLDFQTYLYGVFHRTTLARAGHVVLMPLILTAIIGAVCDVHPVLGAALVTALLFYYAYLGATHRMWGMAMATSALVALLGVAGLQWSAATAASIWSPGWWVLILGLGQALSHVFEDVPPRVNMSSHWTTLQEYFGPAPIRRGLRAGIMLIAGAGNEIWASWRLLPVVVLDLMWRAGYQPDVRAKHAEWLRAACEDGNPAIDFIGRGGGAPVAYS